MTGLAASRDYYRSLDGMRGVGVVFVLVYHFLLLSDFSWSVIGFSWVWIQMFFVQSGFLITRMLLDDRESPFGAYLGRFYWRRVLRIFPVYFGYLLLPALLFLVIGVPEDFDRRAPYLLSFTFNFADVSRAVVKVNLWFIHFWSLSVEEQFYLVWPLLVFFLSRRRLPWFLVAIMVFAPFFRFWLVNNLRIVEGGNELAGRMAYSHTLAQLDAFAFGAVIPVFRLTERVRYPGRWALGVLVVLLLAGGANYLSLKGRGTDLSWTSLGLSGGMTENGQHVWSYSLVNALFMFAVLQAIGDGYRGIFNNRAFARMGKVVYGMYVIHMAVLIAADRLNERYVHSVPLMLVAGFGVTFLMADLSYRYYERRFLDLKDHPPRWLTRRVPS